MGLRSIASALHSVVVPVFNEAEVVDAFHKRASAAMASFGAGYEIVYVDDGSTDGSWERLNAIADRDSHVRLVRFSRNFGHQIAITAGIDHAKGDTVTTIDADLQDPPEVIGELLQAWEGGADVVYAVRAGREGETWFKKLSAATFYRMLRKLTDVDMPVDVGDFRLLSRAATEALRSMPEHHRYVRGMVAWIGYPTASVGYQREARFAGQTKYPLAKMVKFAADGVLAFSLRPLQLATWLGLLVSAAAVVAALWLVVARLTGIVAVVQGWTSLTVLVLLLSGVQLMTIGALGAYLGRTYSEAQHRPLYLVSEVVEGDG